MIQQEFRDSLAAVGTWLKQYGESIYGTRGNIVPPQPWGVVTAKDKTLYVHVLTSNCTAVCFYAGGKSESGKSTLMGSGKAVKFKQQPEGVFVYVDAADADPIDTIIQLETK